MTRWRPTIDEERWLAVASRLRRRADEGELAARTGGWRVTGPLARVALFVLGLVAAALAWGLLGVQGGLGVISSGLVVLVAGEWLIRSRRLHASGVEEGLIVAAVGLLLVRLLTWVSDDLALPALILALLLAGLRLLNSLLTTLAAFVLVGWLARQPLGLGIDATLGYGTFAVLAAVAFGGAALAAGGREFRRPAHDRMLDWVVATLPAGAYLHAGGWAAALQPELLLETAAAAAPRVLVPVALAAFAVAALVVGLRRRTHAPLLAFLGCTAAVLLETYRYVGLPAEAWLVLCGVALLAAGVALDRWLRAPRAGVTSARLTDREGPLDLLQLAGASVLAQRDAPSPAAGDGVTPGGGRYGGGGASGSW
jgi:hypothetical protein